MIDLQNSQAHHRKIIHIDMDAFYASVEQRDNPDLRGRPVAVGGSRARGVVAAASYEARSFGVRSAMPSVTAIRKCPELVFVKPRFDVYRALSLQIRSIFAEYTDLIEPLSLDEAYLDVTVNRKGVEFATAVAKDIRQRILSETGLTASAGISVNKFLSKTASKVRKPNGQFVITPEMASAYIERLEIGEFHGIGKKTEQKMHSLGIYQGLDLRKKSLAFLTTNFGKVGTHYYWISRGVDERSVEPHRERKSIGAETTFGQDLQSRDDLGEALSPLISKVWSTSEKGGIRARTVTLKVKYADFQQITRSKSLRQEIMDKAVFENVAGHLLDGLFPLRNTVRLIGVTLSGLVGAAPDAAPSPACQLSLNL